MKKGITPIIAIVLLILITFVAIGAVAGLVTELTDVGIGEQFLDQQDAEATELGFDAVYAQSIEYEDDPEEAVAVTVRNTGSREVDLSEEIELHFGPEGESPVDLDNLETIFPDWYLDPAEVDEYDSYDCFEEEEDSVLLAPGDTYDCEFTPARFPSGVENINLAMVNTEFDESYTHDCDPASSDDVTC